MKNPSVIIIGAGASGIAAAAKLLEKSIDNVTILEAEDRIGGRIHSIEFGETFVDLGAEYIHGEKNNIVHELSKDFGVLEQGVEAFNEDVYYSDGTKLKCDFIRDLEDLVLDYENLNEEDAQGKSVGELFFDRFNKTLLKKYENDKTLTQILREAPIFAEGQVIMVEGCQSWFDSSAQTDYVVCEGDNTLVWKKIGYKTILEILIKNFPNTNGLSPLENKIRLNSKVVNICWDQNNTVTVLTSNNRIYKADYVIFTPSVGVLKHRKDSLFHPPLPQSKVEAIEKIGYGGVMKIAVSFSEKWWDDDDRAFSFFWSNKDLESIDYLEGPSKNGISWVSQFRDFSKALHNPNVWLGWFGGDQISEIEKLPLEILKKGCHYVLNKFLGKSYRVTEIDRIVSTKWCTNENFLGCYSYVKTGTYRKDFSYQKSLFDPLKNSNGKPVVLFAGEATHPNYYATVHGAIESGFREADRIIDLVQNNQELE